MFLAVGVVIRCGSWRGSPQQLQLNQSAALVLLAEEM